METASKHRLQIVVAKPSRDAHQTETTQPVEAGTAAFSPQAAETSDVVAVAWATNGGPNRSDTRHADVRAVRAGQNGNSADDFGNWTDLTEVGIHRWLPLRTKLREAVFTGAAGFLFDPVEFSRDVRYRNAIAELVNLELALFKPWILRNQSLDRLVHQNSASTFPFMAMYSQHAALLWVPRTPGTEGPQSEPVTLSGSPFISVPDAFHRQVYFLASETLSPARSRKIPGGVRVSLNPDNPYGLLLLTNHPSVLKGYADQLGASGDRYNELFVRIIRFELIRLDQSLADDLSDTEHIAHLRKELHALHSRISPILESTSTRVNYRELDHFLGQLERVQQIISAQD
jgi:hypothetical protein